MWGKKVYEIITKNKNGLDETWKAIPLAISDIIKNKRELNNEEKNKILEIFNYAFKRK